MIIAGIDNSKNSPGIVKFYINDETFKIEKEDFLGITTTKAKKPKTNTGKNCLRFYDKESDDYEKMTFMSDNIIEFVKDCHYIAFESYSFSSNGKVFDIAECTGVLKWRLYHLNKIIRLYAPTLIKMFATTNGKADKNMMIDYYKKIGNPLNIAESQLTNKPYEDIVDAYWITKLLYMELSIRKGFISLHELSEEQIRPFNHISPSSKINLLSMDFIQKK
jgi:Holliday junction resolvasome RuvABC endonuclease subunit